MAQTIEVIYNAEFWGAFETDDLELRIYEETVTRDGRGVRARHRNVVDTTTIPNRQTAFQIVQGLIELLYEDA